MRNLLALAFALCVLLPGFSAETATNSAAGPIAGETVRRDPRNTMSFNLDQVPVLRTEYFGIPAWQYLAAAIFIVIAFYTSKFLNWFVCVRLKKWAEQSANKMDDLLVRLLEGPIKVIGFVLCLQIGLEVFTWPAWLEVWLRKGLYIVVALSLTYMLLKAAESVMLYWRQRAALRDDKSFDDQLFPIISKSLKIFIVVVAVLVTCQNLGLNITSLIASLSIGGLALGLAAQDTVANLFGAVAVFVDKPFRIGDTIKLGDVEGTVENMGLRSTRVRSPDGHLITIPNKTMGNATITNITRRPNIKTTMNIGITYDTPAAKVQEAIKILNEVYRNHPMTFDLIVSFNKFNDSSLNFQIIHWWKPSEQKIYLEGMQELNLRLKEEFDRAGIAFAFPSQTIYVKQDATPQAGSNLAGS